MVLFEKRTEKKIKTTEIEIEIEMCQTTTVSKFHSKYAYDHSEYDGLLNKNIAQFCKFNSFYLSHYRRVHETMQTTTSSNHYFQLIVMK